MSKSERLSAHKNPALQRAGFWFDYIPRRAAKHSLQ